MDKEDQIDVENFAEECSKWYGGVNPKPRKPKRWTKAQHFRDGGK